MDDVQTLSTGIDAPAAVETAGASLVSETTTAVDIDKMLHTLDDIYKSLPNTSGCENCKAKNGDDEMWCCRINTPSMYRVEFIRAWQDLMKWDKDKFLSIFLNACRNYLSNEMYKGCMFFNNGCTVYESRPLACRTYGIVCHENWESRVRYMKKVFGPFYKVRPQCHLVKTEDGQKLSKAKENTTFLRIIELEKELGVSETTISLHDRPGGSYRTFYDHFLLTQGHEDVLQLLTEIKLKNPTPTQIESVINTLKTLMTTEAKNESTGPIEQSESNERTEPSEPISESPC